MAQFPALPLWTDALLADTSHLSDKEFGIYLKLLIIIWRNPACKIPNDNVWIARKFGKTLEDIEEDVMPIIKEFCKSTGNFVSQKRLTKEFLYLKNRSKNQSARAKSRWNKDKVSYPGDAGIDTSGNAPTPTPTPTPTPQEDIDKSISKPKTPRKKGSRIKPDWKPNQENIDYAFTKGLVNGDINEMAEGFLNYWIDSTSKSAIGLDWDAKWRTWVNNKIKWDKEKEKPKTSNRNAGQAVYMDAVKEGLFDNEHQ